MKQILSFFFLCLSLSIQAQIYKPVKWEFATKKVSDTEYDLVATAKIDKNWYIYSQFLDDNGPIPTSLTFEPGAGYQLQGKAAEVSTHKKSGFDKMFEMNITKFSEQVQFIQRIKITGAVNGIKGTVTYQSCDDEKCIPPQDEAFFFSLNVGNAVPSTNLTPTPTLTPTTGNMGTSAVLKPVSWRFEAKKITETEYDLYLNATIQPGWHIYSQFLKGEDGPLPTEITIAKNGAAVGKAKEQSPKRKEHLEPVFNNMKVIDFEESVTFIQRVKITDPQQPVSGSVSFMVCDKSRCLPPDDVPFTFTAATNSWAAATVAPPTPTEAPVAPTEASNDPSKYVFDKSDIGAECTAVAAPVADENSLWLIFLLGFGGGILAFLTPCVLPMVPLTVGFFLKSAKTRQIGIRNALLYGLSIIVIYTGGGVLLTSLAGADALNILSTNVVFNVLLFVLLIVFAFSFFGYYEITLPSSWANATERLSDKGGFLGIFFMAATLAIVSFSCTGLVAGSLLVQIAKGDALSLFGFIPTKPLVGMFGFSLALALPFTLFALFPAGLKTMPKSGGWMNLIKVTLGFLELALAFKFLSVADLTMGWKIVPYEGMLGAWVVIGLALLVYYGGKLRFPHEQPLSKLTPTRYALMVLSLALVGYTASGFRYNAQAGTFTTPAFFSGVLPPAGHSYIYPQECPLNLNCFHDFETGVAYAKAQNKPILIDFTGWGCVNCRKMEDNVWGKPGVYELLRDKYVLISLYVDERKLLDKSYIFEGKERKTVGNKWTDFQIQHFQSNAQPLYVVVNSDLKVLNKPVGYTPEIEKYQAFLQCGLDRFGKK